MMVFTAPRTPATSRVKRPVPYCRSLERHSPPERQVTARISATWSMALEGDAGTGPILSSRRPLGSLPDDPQIGIPERGGMTRPSR